MSGIGVGRTIVAAVCLATLVPTSATASADSPRQRATAEFTRAAPGKATGLTISIDYRNPQDPAAKPPAVRQIALRFARGSRIDTTALPICTAENATLMTTGPAACPESRLGGGEVVLDTGFPEPFRFLENDLTLLNASNEVIFLFQERMTGERLASRAAIKRRRIISTAPFLPGTPPDGAAVDTVSEMFERTGTAGYLTTPKRCRHRGYWTNRLRFTYDDGVVQKVRTASPCRRRAGGSST